MAKSRLIFLLGVAVATLCALVYWRQPPAPPPPVVLLAPTAAFPNHAPIPERWIPRNWGWLYRLCAFVRGKPRLFRCDIEFAERAETMDSLIQGNALGPPLAASNGVAIWFVPKRDLRHDTAPGSISWTSSPRISLADGGTATILSGPCVARVVARLQAHTVDMFDYAGLTNGVQTNFMAACRAQLPYGMNLFIVDTRGPGLATNRAEVMLSATEIDALGHVVAH